MWKYCGKAFLTPVGKVLGFGRSGFNAEKLSPHGANSDVRRRQPATTSETRAGILPKSDVTGKRKLSEKSCSTPHLIHKISTAEVVADFEARIEFGG
jgi:hypothetical protein